MNHAANLVDEQRSFFLSGATRSVFFRRTVLMQLETLLKKNESRFYEAIQQDLRKSKEETYMSELSLMYTEIAVAKKNLSKWMRTAKAKTNLSNLPGKSWIIPEPLGCCLVIGAWNYPYQLCLIPALSALAAGNTVLLKPSELAPETSKLMAELINGTFDPKLFFVQEGGVAETTELLKLKFDKIFFTGSTKVGKIVAQAAAVNLTPVTLELGGKSLAIVAADADIEVAARRIVWGKFLNSGQTCVAPDYVLVESLVHDQLLERMSHYVEQFYGRWPKSKDCLSKIVNRKSFDRLIGLIEWNQVHLGGKNDPLNHFIEPTIVKNVSWSDPVMQEEIFGPILPVIKYQDIVEVVDRLKRQPKPLAFYLFTKSSALKQDLLAQLSFGGATINDTILHLANPYLPFGGVGDSGMGSYHGYHGFKVFSHFKSVMEKSTLIDPPLRYPPFGKLKMKMLRWFLE